MPDELSPEIQRTIRKRLSKAQPRLSICEHVDGLSWNKYSGHFAIELRNGKMIDISFCPFCGVQLP